MQKLIESIKKGNTLCVLIFVLVLAAGLVIVFTFSSGMVSYDMWDYFEGVFWADATLKANAPVNPDYYYFYLLPFGSNIIMAPMIRIFGMSVLANQAGMIVFLALYIWLAIRLADALFPGDKKSILIFTSVLSLFFFTYIGDNLLHHLLAYGIAFVCLLGELSAVIRKENGRGAVTDTVLLIALSLWSGLNGFSAAISTVPVAAAYILMRLRDRDIFRKDSISVILMTTVPCITGLLVFMYCNTSAVSGGYYTRLLFDNVDKIVENLTQDTLISYLCCFSFMPDNVPLFSKRGIDLLIKLAFAMATLLVPAFLIIRERREEGNRERDTDRELLFISCFFVAAVCLAQFVLMESSTLRYLFNAILCLFIVFAYLFTKYIKKKEDVIALLLLFCFVIYMCAESVLYTFPRGQEKRSEMEAISDLILDEGLTRGYICSRYWKVLDITSEGKCCNTTVCVDREKKTVSIEKDRIFSSELEKPDDTDRFYIVTKQSSFEEDSEILAGWSRKIPVSDVYVLIYDIDCWDSLFT